MKMWIPITMSPCINNFEHEQSCAGIRQFVKIVKKNCSEYFQTNMMNLDRLHCISWWISDRWHVTGDRWQVTSDRWQVTGDRWQVIGDRLPVIANRWQVTADRWQMIADRWQLTADRWQVYLEIAGFVLKKIKKILTLLLNDLRLLLYARMAWNVQKQQQQQKLEGIFKKKKSNF